MEEKEMYGYVRVSTKEQNEDRRSKIPWSQIWSTTAQIARQFRRTILEMETQGNKTGRSGETMRDSANDIL